MKAGWPTRKLHDLLEIQNGYAFDSKAFNPSEGMPLIRIRDLKAGTGTETRYSGNYDEKYMVKAGDLLIGMDGEFGCYEWRGRPALLNQRVCRLQGFSSDLVPRFLFYGVNGYLKAIEDITGFATVKHISSKQILGIEFPLPPLPEQQRIVGILDDAFEGIATAKANTEKNLQNARALFESHLHSIFTQRGEGWVEKRLGDLCSIGDGNYSSKYPRASEFLPSGVPFLTATNLKDGTILHDELRYISPGQHSQLLKGHIRTGDLVIVVRGSSTGNSSIVPQCFNGANLNSQLAFLRPKGYISNSYLFYSFNSPPMQRKIKKEISGAAQPQLPNNKLLDIAIYYPPLDEQLNIVHRLDLLRDETQRLESIYQRKLAAMEELKKSLLHQAFNGAL